MKHAVTFIRSFNIRETKKIEIRLLHHAQCRGYKVVGKIQIPRNVLQNITGVQMVERINLTKPKNLKIAAVITVRYHQLHRSFYETLRLIRFLGQSNIQIISVEETLKTNDPIFLEIYQPRPPS